jgi:hypothetical protein
MAEELQVLATAILQRLRDPEADFELQALIRGETESIWLSRRGPRLTVRVVGEGGGELDWADSSYAAVDAQRAFEQLGDRIELLTLFSGGPFPDDLLHVFRPDESGPSVRYRAQWESWEAFRSWLRPNVTRA